MRGSVGEGLAAGPLAGDAIAFAELVVLRSDHDGNTRPGSFRYDGALLRIDLADVGDGGDARLIIRWQCQPRRGLYFLGPDAAVPEEPRVEKSGIGPVSIRFWGVRGSIPTPGPDTAA